ncbi:NADH-quinone oxidoreductase, E subunit [Thermocrinis albus DSM 14484]|uniref:NADH-quinone oxidoreductase, E subunit n=1 Tax=Thermocrinis albus (strain DSM 14484 / JCM 11386 / HI 11/12) TaxID=638303 RepID=D3SLE7_THEAH|nr:NADH-quinone oxidoreductase subunit NuoE [Thermocrinis albus]ADC89577.1 NADH-quinone oxidoreductase, E subunit [Thermocrinis albus DSM 14484]
MLPQELLEKLRQHVQYFPRREQAILLCLHEVQDYYGHIPNFALEEVAKILHVPLNHVESVVAFYDMFDRGEPAKHRIRVCVSVVCHFMKKDQLLNALKKHLGIDFWQVTKDGRFKLIPVQCLGACSCAPVFMIDEDTYQFEGEEKLHEILSRYT